MARLGTVRASALNGRHDDETHRQPVRLADFLTEERVSSTVSEAPGEYVLNFGCSTRDRESRV